MDLIENESFCSNSSSPKDYSLSSAIIMKSEINQTQNKPEITKSMMLNFGVDRLLSKCDKTFEKNLINESFLKSSQSENKDQTGNSLSQINLLQQQLTGNTNGFLNQNFVLKPFPLRFGRSENGKENQ